MTTGSKLAGKIAELLMLLREPRTSKELAQELRISERGVVRWLNGIKNHIPIKKEICKNGKPGGVIKYMWGGSNELTRTYGNLRSLSDCLYALGATVEEVDKARKTLTTNDYKGLVDNMWRQCLLKNRPGEVPDSIIIAFNNAHQRAKHILNWRK